MWNNLNRWLYELIHVFNKNNQKEYERLMKRKANYDDTSIFGLFLFSAVSHFINIQVAKMRQITLDEL